MQASVASLHFAMAMLPQGWMRDVRITVSRGCIARIEPGVPASAGDECHSAALPGLPNLHSHAFQRAMAGLAERRGSSTTSDSFWTWREIMYRFVDRIGPAEMHAIAAMAYMEMLESGFTRVGEFHYLHHSVDGTPYDDPAEMTAALAQAADETGIALTLLPVFYAHSGFSGKAPNEGQRRFLNSLDTYQQLRDAVANVLQTLPDAVIGIAPHSLRACTPHELSALIGMAEHDAPIHIHVAEQMQEVEDCIAWSGSRPVEWLLDHVPLSDRWCLVHATHMTDNEAKAMARSGAVAGLCPITEANLGDGIFPVDSFLDAGGHFGVGSDSNILIDAAEEMRLLEYGQRLQHHGRNRLASKPAESSGGAIFRASLAGGAQALGAKAELSEGCAADLISLDVGHPSLIGRDADAWIDGWIFASHHDAIDCVWRRGRKMVASGRHIARETIIARYREVLTSLLA
ncbi:formimidoylglutamate deiminase [Parasphingorhabdus sp.]|uniref:formimidoylglutamate deiminase n=1 Tax=Parasphingorhabdus sp. TaxID=2709688 RepID=UPI002B27BDE6|nr:formimidoylglutamate deiminase [Parasphingorhabdus sp.]